MAFRVVKWQRAVSSNAEPPDSENLAGDRSPQFSLRALFAVVAVISGIFASAQLIGSVGAVVLAWFLLLAAAHVSANRWGSRVARQAKIRAADVPAASSPQAPAHAVRQSACTPTTRLGARVPLGRSMLVVAVLGAVAGGAAGGMLLSQVNLGNLALLGMLVGTLSSCVVGGFGGFLASTFINVGLRALAEALREPGAGGQPGQPL